MGKRTEYHRNWKRERLKDPAFRARHAQNSRKSAERRALKIFSDLMEREHWPLRQGYNAAERGQPCDGHQSADWQCGWRLWHRRNGRAA